MGKSTNIAVIGGGSWATAIVKMLSNNLDQVNWWIRNEKNIKHIQQYRHNPNYLPSIELDVDKLQISNDIQEVIRPASMVILAVPSAFIKDALEECPSDI
ncbi:MAG TPA: glycerol-3-phosphate dehydrogenase, partial [Flavobacteriales bacterium]|nr:glycerol-3-phosphate dehydrogenase [Flavobacteriales bacterium]